MHRGAKRKGKRSGPLPKQIDAEERVRKAVRLWGEGLTYDEIAKRLGWAGRQGVHNALTRYYSDLNEETKELALHVRAMKLEQLDRVLAGLIVKGAYKGNTFAAAEARKVIETQAKILGLLRSDVTLNANVALAPGAHAEILGRLSRLAESCRPRAADPQPEPSGSGGAPV